MVFLFGAELDFAPSELSGLLLDKNVMLFTAQKNRLRGNTSAGQLVIWQIDRDKHLGFEQTLRIVNGASDSDRPRGRIDELGNSIDMPCENLTRKSAAAEGKFAARAKARQIHLSSVDLNPEF